MLQLHKWKLIALLLASQITLTISLCLAPTKSLAAINWLDVISEGGCTVLSLVWLLLILQSRPKGRVTQWLSFGLGLIFLSQFQDLLDEFIAFPKALAWDHWIESGFMLPGLGLLTYGIYLWHQEQLLISQQLRKRERLFREHSSLDKITNLSRADYLRKQLDKQLSHHRAQQLALTILLLDINDFDQFNRLHGHAEGDRYLLSVSELLLLNIRHNDLLCRYAGDRFALILPLTDGRQAQHIAEELHNVVRHFAFKSQQGESLFTQASVGLATATNHDNAEALLARATHALLQNQQRHQRSHTGASSPHAAPLLAPC